MTFRIATEVTPNQVNNSDPLADLNNDNFSYDLYQYPIVSNIQYPDKNHNIVFYINIPQLSSWNKGAQNGATPVANRGNVNSTRFGLRNEDNNGDTANGVVSGIENLVLNNKTVRTTAAISLYIPNTMIFMQNAQYQVVSLTEALGLIGDTVQGVNSLIEGDAVSGLASLGTLAGRILKEELGKNFSGLIGKGARDAGLAALGIADNPQNFLLFKQVDFRKFQFDFILTPETPQEAQIIKQIIYLFRFHSSPEVKAGSTGGFFVPPSMFDIDFIHNGKRNENIPRISTCVVTSVSVDYAAAGQWSTYYDGVPLQTRLTIDLTETEIITKDRVQEGF